MFKTTHGRDNRKSAGSGLLLKHKGENMCMHFLFRSVLSPVLWYSENILLGCKQRVGHLGWLLFMGLTEVRALHVLS